MSVLSRYIRLTYERNKRHWTQTQVGQLMKALGGYHRVLTQNEVSLIERGRLLPDAEQLAALGRLFKISPASMLLKPCPVSGLPEETPEPNDVEQVSA